MTETSNDTIETVDPVVEAGVREAVEALRDWQTATMISAIDDGIIGKWRDMLEGQGAGTVKNNAFNRGYMQALRDIHHSLQLLINKEDLNAIDEEVPEGSTGLGRSSEVQRIRDTYVDASELEGGEPDGGNDPGSD